MKILIEGTPSFKNRSGVGQYVFNLLKELFALDKKNTYMIYGYILFGKKFTSPFKNLPKNVKLRLVRFFPSKFVNLSSRKFLPPPIDLLTLTKPELVIFTNFVRSPLITSAKSISIIYDLSFEKYGQYSDKKNVEVLKRQVPNAVKNSNLIITISENSKEEIAEFYNIDPKKIKIVYPAINHNEFKLQKYKKTEAVKQKYGINQDYILYTGTLEPRKNIVGILESYANLSTELRSKYALVLAGGKGWKDEEIEKKLEQFKKLNIIRTGYVDDKDLPALYSGATLFVYPSFYEGFGMPPLEAMACGTPVITANNSSLPEVVGDAAILIDAKDVDALTKNIEKVLQDEKIQRSMIQKGLKRAKVYSWQKSAQKLHKIIEGLG